MAVEILFGIINPEKIATDSLTRRGTPYFEKWRRLLLSNIFYRFDLRCVLFNSGFHTGFHGADTQTTRRTSALKTYFNVLLIFYGNQTDIAAIGIQKWSDFVQCFFDIDN